MPELQKDPITGRWVIISTERGKRPNEFLRESVTASDPKNCPFCPGSESKTPSEILVYGRNGDAKNTPGWKIRVVPNKFPALGIEGDLDRETANEILSMLHPKEMPAPAGLSIHYKWSDMEAQLARRGDDPGDPYDDLIVEYRNPKTGGSVLPSRRMTWSSTKRTFRFMAASVYFSVNRSVNRMVNMADRA